MTTVLATNLYKAARKVKPVGRAAYPILACIRLSHHEGRLQLTTWHPDAPQIEYVSARTDSDLFETCVPARAFTDWLYVTQVKQIKTPKNGKISDAQYHAWQSDKIELTFDPKLQILKIRAGNTRAEFKCIDALEFPASNPYAAASEFEAIANSPVFQNV